MKVFFLLLLSLLLLNPVSAYSGTNYAGLDYAMLAIDGVDGGKSTPDGWQLKAGHRFTRYLAVETLVNLNSTDSRFKYNQGGGAPANLLEENATLNHLYGLFAVLSQSLTGFGFGGFVKAGLVNIEVTGTAQSLNASNSLILQSYEDTQTGLAGGIGINVGRSPDRAFMVEYNVYPNTKDVNNNNLKNSAFNLGVKMRF